MFENSLLSSLRFLCCCSCSYWRDQRRLLSSSRLELFPWAKPLPSLLTYAIRVAFAGCKRSSSRMVPGTRSLGWRRRRSHPTAPGTSPLGEKTTPQLQAGNAKLIVEATSNDLLRKTGHAERELTVVTQPPTVSVDSEQHYLYLGMADLATFNVSGSWTEAGVRVGDEKFRAWPMPGGKPGMFSMFAFAWNMPPNTVPLVYAANGAGNDVTSPLVVVFPKKEQPKYKVHDLQVSDAFMQKVINELDPNGTGDPITRFVKINSEMRRANNKTLSDLRFKTADRFLWSRPFIRQSHSQAESNFADLRNYIYHGQKIDQQVHLGYDLAVTQHVGVEASNDGKLVQRLPWEFTATASSSTTAMDYKRSMATWSRIDVHEGDTVKQGQVMGLSGMTGMAGGDHIHFAMQLDGVQIIEGMVGRTLD